MVTLVDVLNNVKGEIGVDIDDTAVPLTDKIVLYINRMFHERLPREFTTDDMIIHGIEKTLLLAGSGMTRNDTLSVLREIESDGIMEQAPLKPYCLISLQHMIRKNDIYFVTSRDNGYYVDARGMTEKWIKFLARRYGFAPSGPVVYNHKKHETLSKSNIQLFFEDNPHFALDIMGKGVPVILFNMPLNILNPNDIHLLPRDIYEEKRLLIEKLDSYTGRLLFRVDDWEQVYHALGD